jgi:Bacterial lipid A biosynthesis acyltransferase
MTRALDHARGRTEHELPTVDRGMRSPPGHLEQNPRSWHVASTGRARLITLAIDIARSTASWARSRGACWVFTSVVVSATAMTLTRPNFPVRAPRLADRLEAWGAAFFFGVFKLLPLDCASAVGGGLARRIGPFLGVSRHARRNVRRAFPEPSETEIADLIGGMWSNLGRVAARIPASPGNMRFEPGGRVETHGFEHVDRAVAAGRRMIVFSGHIANWEIGMLTGVQHGVSVPKSIAPLTIH